MTRWTPSKDGINRTEIRITFRLSADDLATLLAAEEGEVAPDGGRTIDGIQAAIRSQLYAHGLDNLMDAEPEEVHRDAIAQAFGGPGAVARSAAAAQR